MGETAIPQQTTSDAIKAGWVCLILGLILMLIPFPLFYIFGPLCVVAFILAIVGLAKGQTGKGIALLISSLVLPPIFWFIGWGVLGAMLRLSQYGLEDQVSRRSIEMARDKALRQTIQQSIQKEGKEITYYTLGTAGAAVVIKEFSDYTSPHSKRIQEPLEQCDATL